MAVAQKADCGRCFEDKSGVPAWKSKPSWYQVSANDRMIPPGDPSLDGGTHQAKEDHYIASKSRVSSLPPDEVVALIAEAAGSLCIRIVW